MRLRSRSFAALAMIGLLFGMAPVAPVRAATTVTPGDLIRGTSFSAVYYMGEDGFRYVFPNEKTYATWYSDAETGALDFSAVKTLTDSELSAIQMGGNVTYRPGLRMIKINSDPKTYFVNAGGTLQWVSSEETAVLIYGDAWNTYIDDVPDGFFGNYVIGTPLTVESVTDSASGSTLFLSHTFGGTSSISDDKGLSNYTWIPIEGMVFGSLLSADSITTIVAGQTVMWTNNDTENHTATADDDSWGTGTLKTGQNFVRRFDTPGTYTYYCSYHPEMTGTIVVTEAEVL